MKHIFKVFLSTLFIFSNVFSDYYDSKMIQWKQPNGVEFTARLRVDEFSFHMETSSGYTIKQGENRYYYYAILDSNGEYSVSDRKVGIDEPLHTSYRLNRSDLPPYNVPTLSLDFTLQALAI